MAKIVIDTKGGDKGAAVMVKGAAKALEIFGFCSVKAFCTVSRCKGHKTSQMQHKPLPMPL